MPRRNVSYTDTCIVANPIRHPAVPAYRRIRFVVLEGFERIRATMLNISFRLLLPIITRKVVLRKRDMTKLGTGKFRWKLG